MLTLFWNLGVALNGYMRFYMPTNRAVDFLRSPRGLKWAIPVALLAGPTYLFAMSACVTIVEQAGPGFFNILVLLFAWNTMKFASLGIVASLTLIARRLGSTNVAR